MIDSQPAEANKRVAPHGNNQGQTTEQGDIHNVEVKEIVHTSKYSYLKVVEKESEFWIAAVKSDFVVGEKYIYQGGVLMKDFKSKELDRVFDEVYFVQQIIPASGHGSESANTSSDIKSSTPPSQPPAEGVTSLKDIISNPDQYKDKQVKVYGEVIKINLGIMNRNWIHVKDGTADEHDFVITSGAQVPLGQSVTFEGVITIDKDFGAGYVYALIMEEAKVVE